MRPAVPPALKVVWTAIATLLVIALTGCANADPVNVPLTRQAQNDEPHDFSVPNLARHPAILIALSGGGSRATALGLNVLQELARYRYVAPGIDERLTDDIRAISSVSGGSVAAAYFVYKYPDPIDDLRNKFLEQNNMATLEWQAVFPITWFRLAFTKYTRAEALQDLFSQRLFGQATFGDINKAGKPMLILNSTDMASGEVFTFTPSRFDDICSDLSLLPLSAAVAASADFPVALSPMTVQNFSNECRVRVPLPGWVSYDLSPGSLARYLDIEEFKRARYTASLRHLDSQGQPTAPANSAYRDVEYIHLLDGGVADNAGAHALVPLFAKNYGAGHLFDGIQKGYVKKIVILTVNARADPPSDLDVDPSTPGVIASVRSVTSVPIDATTAAVNVMVREADFTLAEQRLLAPPDAAVRDLDVYDIAIDFDQITDRKLREQVKQIKTSWTLTTTELDTIDSAARSMLQQHPCFQRLLADLGIEAEFVRPATARFCVTKPPDTHANGN